jgi:hypothetical protein
MTATIKWKLTMSHGHGHGMMGHCMNLTYADLNRYFDMVNKLTFYSALPNPSM